MHSSPARPRLLTGFALVVTAGALLLIPAGPTAAKASSECPTGGVKVMAGASPATVTVNDAATGTGVQVVVTITGSSFTIAPVAGTQNDASWCLKASTRTQTGIGMSGANTDILNRIGSPHAIGYLVVYMVSTSHRPGWLLLGQHGLRRRALRRPHQHR